MEIEVRHMIPPKELGSCIAAGTRLVWLSSRRPTFFVAS